MCSTTFFSTRLYARLSLATLLCILCVFCPDFAPTMEHNSKRDDVVFSSPLKDDDDELKDENWQLSADEKTTYSSEASSEPVPKKKRRKKRPQTARAGLAKTKPPRPAIQTSKPARPAKPLGIRRLHYSSDDSSEEELNEFQVHIYTAHFWSDSVFSSV